LWILVCDIEFDPSVVIADSRRSRGHSNSGRATLWDSLDAVVAFAGEDYEAAVFYPEDDRYLIERDLRVKHYQVVATSSESGAVTP
jgi:hypothetical protein